MSSTKTLTPSNLSEYYSIESVEKLLNDITEPHPDIICNSFEPIFWTETRQEPLDETFYYWVHTTLTIGDLETLYTDVEDEYFKYEPPSIEDYENKLTEISTQQLQRRWLGIWDQ